MSVSEFDLIAEIVDQLGAQATADWVTLGPGDDGSVVHVHGDRAWVGSIDTLLADVHFPAEAPAQLIGYRALMVSLSDLAAMAATPRYALVALTLPDAEPAWLRQLAAGMAEAAAHTGIAITGGNLSRGPLSISVSVHGDCSPDDVVTRHGARVGEQVCVSGPLGGAAACVRQQLYDTTAQLTDLQSRYFKPRARVDLVTSLRGQASAAIDVSDGLVQDLGHLADASQVGLRVYREQLPVFPGATLADALYGGDDYELICTSAGVPEGFVAIGEVLERAGPAAAALWLDDEPLAAVGYDHFRQD
ncbi:MAG: thiamine-phosphate kinase [Pseudomonadota bacterium]